MTKPQRDGLASTAPDGFQTSSTSHTTTIPQPLGDQEIRERYRLTARQTHVALLLYWRRTDVEIADLLGIRRKTVESHVSAVLLRLNVHSRRELEALLANPVR